jgi:serine phosphatase RsbU (regulator of sigma subunit)
VSKYDGNRVEAIEAALKRGETIPERIQQDLKKANGQLVKSFTHFTEKEGLSNNTILSMLEDKSGNLWFGSRFGLSKLSPQNNRDLVFFSENAIASKEAEGKIFFKNYTYEDGFLGIGVNGGGKTICEDKNGTIWVAANGRLTVFHPQGEIADTVAPNIQLTSIALFNENIAWLNLEKKKDSTLTLGNGVSVGDFEFDGITKWYSLPENLSLAYNNNYLTFNFIGITQKQSKKIKYQYKLEGIDENWSAITNRTEAPYGNLPQGKYSFKVKAMNSEGYWSEEFNYTFIIRPPWWETWWFRSLMGLVFVVSLFSFYRWRTAALRRDKEILEDTVEKRTHELAEKTIVAEANEKDAISQRHLVEEKNKEILDSINYALRIQQAFLPDKKEIYSSLPQSFILFKPKDIVSGDFYFFHKNEDAVVIAAVDCTGHGVPGAFMSMVGSERLTDSVQQSNNTSEILSLLNKGVKTSLKQSSKDESTRDGMDIALCSVDTKNRIVKYAGANRPVWIIRNGQTEVEEIKATKVAIGGLTSDDQHFDTHEIKLQQGDTFYICTDGYADQFSGKDGKKLMTRKLKEILVGIQNKSMQEQEQHLDNFVEDWKAGIEQVDDILVIGIRV